MNAWTFEHAVPGTLLALGWGAVVVLTLLSAWRHLRRERQVAWLLALRLLFLALLGWVLLLPARRAALTEIIRPRFLVVLDTSASMAQPVEDPHGTNRWAAAQAMLARDWRRAVSAACQVELIGLDAALSSPLPLDSSGTLEPVGSATHLCHGLGSALARYRGQDLAGVLLLSDGIDTREPSDTWTEDRTWPAPIYAVELDTTPVADAKPDVRVEVLDTPRRAVLDWDTRLAVTVAGQGLRDQAFPVRLLRNGDLVEEVPAQLPPEGGTQELGFKLTHPRVGNELWTVTIPPLPNEAQTNDNALAVVVEVVDARNRLLYIEDVPRWESKYLNRELLANRDITPLAFVRGPGGQFMSYTQRGGVTLDLTEAQLALYKIVILGDLRAESLGGARAEALRAFVERGGSLVLLGGPNAWGAAGLPDTALAPLLPFTRPAGAAIEGRFTARWTADGRGHPALAAEPDLPEVLPPVLTVFSGAQLGAASLALVEAETPAGWQPILVARTYGQGKVVTLLTDSLWRWQLQPGVQRPYADLWRRLIEWLSPGETQTDTSSLELFSGVGRLDSGETAELTARLTLAGGGEIPPGQRVVCEIQTPDNRVLPLDMTPQTVRAGGREFAGYVARFAPQAPGSYRAVARTEVRGQEVTSAPFLFQMRATTQESQPRPFNAPALRALARTSGGRYGSPEAIDGVLQSLRFDPRRETRVEYTSLWQKHAILALLLALLLAEWIIRKVRGLA